MLRLPSTRILASGCTGDRGLRLSVGLAVGGWGHRAPHGTGDDNDGQQIRQHAEELKWYVHAGDLDPATECLGTSKQETRIKGAQRLSFAEDHRRERDEPAAAGHVGEKLADLL